MNLNLRMAAGQTAVMAAAGLASAALLQASPGADARESAHWFLTGALSYPLYVALNLCLLPWTGRRRAAGGRPKPEQAETLVLSTRLLVCLAVTLVAAAAVGLGVLVQSLRVLPVVAGIWAAGDAVDRMAQEAAGTEA